MHLFIKISSRLILAPGPQFAKSCCRCYFQFKSHPYSSIISAIITTYFGTILIKSAFHLDNLSDSLHNHKIKYISYLCSELNILFLKKKKLLTMLVLEGYIYIYKCCILQNIQKPRFSLILYFKQTFLWKHIYFFFHRNTKR